MADPIEVLPQWAIDMALKIEPYEQGKTPVDGTTDGEQATAEVQG